MMSDENLIFASLRRMKRSGMEIYMEKRVISTELVEEDVKIMAILGTPSLIPGIGRGIRITLSI